MTRTVQLDLFGEVEAEESSRSATLAAESAWLETIKGPIVPAPWTMQFGVREGEPTQTWRCPACGYLELSPYGLLINHGVASYQSTSSRTDWHGGYQVLPDGTLSERPSTVKP